MIGLRQATISGCDIRILGDFLTMRDSCGSLLIKVPRSENRLYKTQLKVGKPYCLKANIDEESWLWHVRLGHIGFGAVNLMHKLAKGVPVIKHQDQFLSTIVLGKEIITFHTDRGGKFTSHDFNRVCDQEGIALMLIASYASQQNGIVERRNHTLLKMTRCIIKARGLPNHFWGEAVRHATYIINQTPTRAFVGVTPYEKFYGEKLNLEDLKVFGCVAYERIVSKQLKKLDDNSKRKAGNGRLKTKKMRKEEEIFTVLWNDTQRADLEQQFNGNTNMEQSTIHATEMSSRKGWCLNLKCRILEDLERSWYKDCNATLYQMEKDLKLSKGDDEPEVEATQYRKVVGCLRYLLHIRPDLTYSVDVVQLRLVLNTIGSNDMKLVGYSDSSHNVDTDDGRSTTGHVFYLSTSSITWCSQKQTTVVLSSREAEFMAAIAATCQAIWLRELLAEVT
ncbi:zinc finger, CCHC-type containing protein [Tanacetum coccineum]